MSDTHHIWKELKGIVTPGGDPYWICPVCAGDGHVMGIETLDNSHYECAECKTKLIYPWEDKGDE